MVLRELLLEIERCIQGSLLGEQYRHVCTAPEISTENIQCAHKKYMRANKLETALSRDRLYSLSGPTRYGFFNIYTRTC